MKAWERSSASHSFRLTSDFSRNNWSRMEWRISAEGTLDDLSWIDGHEIHRALGHCLHVKDLVLGIQVDNPEALVPPGWGVFAGYLYQ